MDKDLEQIFYEVIGEYGLNLDKNKKENTERANSGIKEYSLEATLFNFKELYIGFSCDGECQHLGIIDDNSKQYMTFDLNKNNIIIFYLYNDREILTRLAILGRNKKINFLKKCIENTKNKPKYAFDASKTEGYSLKQEFNYQETKELINIFLNYIINIKSNQKGLLYN